MGVKLTTSRFTFPLSDHPAQSGQLCDAKRGVKPGAGATLEPKVAHDKRTKTPVLHAKADALWIDQKPHRRQRSQWPRWRWNDDPQHAGRRLNDLSDEAGKHAPLAFKRAAAMHDDIIVDQRHVARLPGQIIGQLIGKRDRRGHVLRGDRGGIAKGD